MASITSIDVRDRFRGALVGLAAGDAVGTTVEFKTRGTFEPVTDMVGGGPFGLDAGQWTDDTSMALCLATSLVEKQGFDAHDQMNRYVNWWHHGYLSSNGECFDIGMTVSDALARFERSGEPFSGSTAADASGNGSLMRLSPVVLYYFPDADDIALQARQSSRTTHGSRLCLDGCELFAHYLRLALAGETREAILGCPPPSNEFAPQIARIAGGAYRDKTRDEITGSGFVVESLEAALWCFWHGSSFEESILLATNLGEDADTTAAICGQLAGACYGEWGIPARWLERLTMLEDIRKLADQLGR